MPERRATQRANVMCTNRTQCLCAVRVASTHMERLASGRMPRRSSSMAWMSSSMAQCARAWRPGAARGAPLPEKVPLGSSNTPLPEIWPLPTSCARRSLVVNDALPEHDELAVPARARPPRAASARRRRRRAPPYPNPDHMSYPIPYQAERARRALRVTTPMSAMRVPAPMNVALSSRKAPPPLNSPVPAARPLRA